MKKISSEGLNFIIAACAILISAASFYATYLQARSAEQQVKAMTYPLVQFEHGNYDLSEQKEKLYFRIRNAAVGPALIKSAAYLYQGQKYPTINDFLNACCKKEADDYFAMIRAGESSPENNMITAAFENIVLTPNGHLNTFTLYKTDVNKALWEKINEQRFHGFAMEVCYCSLLEQCYLTDNPSKVEEVPQCS